ncbi:MAG: OsmC family protein, partial [Alphaproteobacteria bacterium]|nr:OsmC family protein [Alphaproteobacteria bacterium]
GLGGSGEGTNPEQLFALGWANCFNGAVLFIAGQKKLDASKAVVTCEVGIGREEGGLGLSAKLTLAVPGPRGRGRRDCRTVDELAAHAA